jgi:hypothetical protein
MSFGMYIIGYSCLSGLAIKPTSSMCLRWIGVGIICMMGLVSERHHQNPSSRSTGKPSSLGPERITRDYGEKSELDFEVRSAFGHPYI